jgi:hypothetical protein
MTSCCVFRPNPFLQYDSSMGLIHVFPYRSITLPGLFDMLSLFECTRHILPSFDLGTDASGLPDAAWLLVIGSLAGIMFRSTFGGGQSEALDEQSSLLVYSGRSGQTKCASWSSICWGTLEACVVEVYR